MLAAEFSIDPGSVLVGIAAILTAIVALRRRKTDALIKQELSPNGGSSMKDHSVDTNDRLAQIEAVQGATFDVLDSINQQNHAEHSELWKRLAEHGIDRRQEPR